MVLVWEYLFCDVDLHFVVVILHLSSFVDVFHFVVVSSFDFQATLPFHHHSTLASQTREASTSSELYPDYFWLPFLFHLPRALRFWVGIFYPQAFFTLCSFPTFLAHSQHFGTTCFYQGFTGSRQLRSWNLQNFILILKTQTRPICLLGLQ